MQRAVKAFRRKDREDPPRRSAEETGIVVDHAVAGFFSAFLPKYCASACPV